MSLPRKASLRCNTRPYVCTNGTLLFHDRQTLALANPSTLAPSLPLPQKAKMQVYHSAPLSKMMIAEAGSGKGNHLRLPAFFSIVPALHTTSGMRPCSSVPAVAHPLSSPSTSMQNRSRIHHYLCFFFLSILSATPSKLHTKGWRAGAWIHIMQSIPRSAASHAV